MDLSTQLYAWLGTLSSDPESVRWAFVAIVAFSAFMMTVGVALLVSGLTDPIKRRIGGVTKDQTGSAGQDDGVSRLVGDIGGVMLPKAIGSKKVGNIAKQLRYAGYNSPSAIRLFFGARLIGVVLGAALVLGWALLSGKVSFQLALLYALGAAALAYVLPDIWLSRKARQRQQRIRRGLPDALDLLVVCAEAGLGLNAAIQRVAGEIDIQHPDLASELNLLIMQTRAGVDVNTALRDLDARTNIDDLRSFVTTLMQSMRFGTSISESLRIYAEDMRDKRLQRAQEQAAKLSIKMLAPIALCMMPAFLLVAIGPAILSLMQAMKTMK
jgi:tight adherence protein C